MTAIAIDDEPIALEVIKAFRQKVPFLDLKACFTNAFEGIIFTICKKTKPMFYFWTLKCRISVV